MESTHNSATTLQIYHYTTNMIPSMKLYMIHFLVSLIHNYVAIFSFVGYICVRGFDRNTRYPKPICAKLHATNERNGTGENSRKKKKTSQEGKKIDDKSSFGKLEIN